MVLLSLRWTRSNWCGRWSESWAVACRSAAARDSMWFWLASKSTPSYNYFPIDWSSIINLEINKYLYCSYPAMRDELLKAADAIEADKKKELRAPGSTAEQNMMLQEGGTGALSAHPLLLPKAKVLENAAKLNINEVDWSNKSRKIHFFCGVLCFCVFFLQLIFSRHYWLGGISVFFGSVSISFSTES